MTRALARGSLGRRLLVATLVSVALALAGAHWGLTQLFRDHVLRQFDLALEQQLDQLTARFETDAAGQPVLAPRGLSDPRWERPLSGLYWQIEPLAAAGGAAASAPRALLRSRSLWDTELRLPPDALADGVLHRHDIAGPRGEPLRALERTLRAGDDDAGPRWRLVVAGELGETGAAVARFSGVLAASLAALALLLALAAVAQGAVALAPLRALGQALQRLRDGRQPRLDGRFPAELQPLVDDFNGVLERQDEAAARARAEAGDLAHALKTPLAILEQAAHEATRTGAAGPPAALVAEQVQAAQRHLQWHLARSRAAAVRAASDARATPASPVPGRRAAVAPVVQGLLRTMARLHAERALALDADGTPAGLAVAADEPDLQQMLGNLIDNACRSAARTVRVSAQRRGSAVEIGVEDDGPGIPPAQREAVLRRGVRLDESRAGSGLGLAIVVDLARAHGGEVVLADSPLGGLAARLVLPAAD